MLRSSWRSQHSLYRPNGDDSNFCYQHQNQQQQQQQQQQQKVLDPLADVSLPTELPIDDEVLIVEQHIDDNDDDESDDVSDVVGDENSDDVSERWKGYFIGPNGFRQTRTGEVAAQEQPQTQPLKKVNDDYFADQAEVVNEPPAPSVEAASLATMEEAPLGGATEAAVEAESSTDAMPTSIGRSRVGEETTSEEAVEETTPAAAAAA